MFHPLPLVPWIYPCSFPWGTLLRRGWSKREIWQRLVFLSDIDSSLFCSHAAWSRPNFYPSRSIWPPAVASAVKHPMLWSCISITCTKKVSTAQFRKNSLFGSSSSNHWPVEYRRQSHHRNPRRGPPPRLSFHSRHLEVGRHGPRRLSAVRYSAF